MTDQLPDAVHYLLLVLLYVFFGRVLWAVWSEVRTPTLAQGRTRTPRTTTKASSKSGVMTFTVIEPRTRRGQSFTLSSTLDIGRDDDCDIAIDDDSFVSSRHARIEVRPEGPWVVDLGSTNGTFLNGNRIMTDRLIRRGDRIQVGSTVLEAR